MKLTCDSFSDRHEVQIRRYGCIRKLRVEEHTSRYESEVGVECSKVHIQELHDVCCSDIRVVN
jgi:hypothetical protein